MKKKKSLIVEHYFWGENSNTAYFNKKSFTLKIKFCVFQVTTA